MSKEDSLHLGLRNGEIVRVDCYAEFPAKGTKGKSKTFALIRKVARRIKR